MESCSDLRLDPTRMEIHGHTQVQCIRWYCRVAASPSLITSTPPPLLYIKMCTTGHFSPTPTRIIRHGSPFMLPKSISEPGHRSPKPCAYLPKLAKSAFSLANLFLIDFSLIRDFPGARRPFRHLLCPWLCNFYVMLRSRGA